MAKLVTSKGFYKQQGKVVYPFPSSVLFIHEGAVVNHMMVPAVINILQVSGVILSLKTSMAGTMDKPRPVYEIIFTSVFIGRVR